MKKIFSRLLKKFFKKEIEVPVKEYSVIYLWEEDKDGVYRVKHPCKVCQEIKRNVIEPVAVFVPKGKKEEYREKLLKIESEEELQKVLEEEIYKDVEWYKKPKTHLTCILHCHKENSIWIRNFGEYKEYARSRDEAILKTEVFKGEFPIKWNWNLIVEFFRRIRAYRFVVDYEENIRPLIKDWNKFLENLNTLPNFRRYKKQLLDFLIGELNTDKDIILFNLYFSHHCISRASGFQDFVEHIHIVTHRIRM